MKLKVLVHHLKKTEKIILTFLILILVAATYRLGTSFYFENSEMDFIPGGVYVEGGVGKVDVLNPLFIQQGTISNDITGLIFSGLTKYDTQTGEIVGDLANVKANENGKEYTFVIKDGATWHDGEKVSADDVIFTYETVIKNPEFKGDILNYNDYSGIKAAKIDERTVKFLLEKPDSFFLVKTMVGILPKHLLELEPIAFLESSPYNFAPIGSGPYRFVSQIPFADHVEYGLEAYDGFYDGKPNIKSILFKVFDSFDNLLKNTNNLNAIRSVPGEFTEEILNKDKFVIDRYELPQYVAVFINSASPKLKETNVRLALQLGTDKEGIIEAINENVIIDTPLLEIDQENWVNQYSITRANGALFETQWQIPNKDELKEDSETENENTEDKKDVSPTGEVTYINSPNEGKDWQTTREPITITGTAPAGTKAIYVNDYELKKFVPGDKGWSYIAAGKFDSIKEGENVFEVIAEDEEGEKTLIDAITIVYGTPKEFSDNDKERLSEENSLAGVLPTRENKTGEKLELILITSKKPKAYGQVADLLKEQWQKIGVTINIEILDNGEFQSRLSDRDYDLLLFGQNLGYNLDAYPYWHSSQAGENGLNLSSFKNFVVDSLLEKARLEDGESRQDTLNDIQEIISQEVPAIFLYSPTYYTALTKDIQHPDFKHLATTSDRLANIEDWFAKVNRKFRDGVNPLTFLSWFIKQF